MTQKATGLLAGAIVGLVTGSLWGVWFPINKRLWTSSYVLYAAGWTLLTLAICYFVIDIKKHQGAWTYPWRVFGANAIFAYAFAELLSIVLEVVQIGSNGTKVSLKEQIYSTIFTPIADPALASLLYSLSFVIVCFIPCLILFRKQIFLKI